MPVPPAPIQLPFIPRKHPPVSSTPLKVEVAEVRVVVAVPEDTEIAVVEAYLVCRLSQRAAGVVVPLSYFTSSTGPMFRNKLETGAAETPITTRYAASIGKKILR